MWGKLALISSEYGVLHLFNGVDDEDLAHALYRVVVEDLYNNPKAREAENFGQGTVGHEMELLSEDELDLLNEEYETSWEPEGESGQG